MTELQKRTMKKLGISESDFLPKPSANEKIAQLEAENERLKEQLSATMEAVDFLLFGETEG